LEIKKICVLGLGYIGLPTASLIANNGFEVAGVDNKETLIDNINNGGVHIEEPGLKRLINPGLLFWEWHIRVTLMIPEKARF